MLQNPNWNKSNPVADVLLKGADLIEKRGLAKYVRVDDNGGLCFLGAINVAMGYNDGIGWDDLEGRFVPCHLELEAAQAVADTLDIKHTNDGRTDIRSEVAEWNNEAKRTAEEVIDAMRLAAYQKQFA